MLNFYGLLYWPQGCWRKKGHHGNWEANLVAATLLGGANVSAFIINILTSML
jgi:hypothetical protein